MVVAVIVEIQTIEQRESRFGPLELSHGNRSVHAHDRRAGDLLEALIQQRDLLPVSRLPQVKLGNRGLDGVGPASVQRERALQLSPTFLDLLPVPQRPVLIIEQDELAIAKAGGATRVVDEHQAKQRVRLGFVGHETHK